MKDFRVTRSDELGIKEKFYDPQEGQAVLYVFESPTGQQVGVEMKHDGTLTIGGWDSVGEWVQLETVEPCDHPNCELMFHGKPFSLTQYAEKISTPSP